MNYSEISNNLKRFIFIIQQMLLKHFWRLSGGRRTKAMGLSLNFHPDTVWPGRRGLKLPQEDCKSKIVAYADLVQAHALCNALSIMNESPVIIDVGAHHGEYVCLLGGLMKSAKGGIIIAVEPDTDNIAILKDNIVRNNLQDIVTVVECAVSDFTGAMSFTSHGSEGHLSAVSNENKRDFQKVKVETLRDIIRRFNLKKVDILLIDVEGAELPVLKGFPWESIKPAVIFCELHPYNWSMFGYAGKDMAEFIRLHHYRCFDMYFQEYISFNSPAYIGPCLFLPY